MRLGVVVGTAVATTLSAPLATVAAEPWLVADVPAAFPVSAPHARAFRTGVLPAIGVYQPVMPWFAVAVRGRAGVLGDGDAPMGGLADPGWGGLGTVTIAARASGPRQWIELAAGGGVTGADVVPTFELGAGWSTRLGSFEVGPSVRYLRVEAGGGVGLGTAQLMLVGVELRRGPARRRVPPRARPAIAAAPERDEDRLIDVGLGCADDASCVTDAEADDDTLVEVLESCRVLTAMIDGGGASDGCADGGPIVVEADRIILSERVLFAVARARVRTRARPLLRAIAATWRERGWQQMIVEGHADVRGDAAYNTWLSQVRAERARSVLIEAGVPAAAIVAVGVGASRPRSTNHDSNRRVEFIILPRRVP